MPSRSDLPVSSFLVFRLWGPMAAWGDIAVGERRGTWSRPSRSAILGLVAAALGIERANSAAHQRLEEGLGFAVRVDDPGRPVRDYHTAQSPSRKSGKRWATRRDELSPDNDLNTILSERTYQLEMNAVVLIWRRPDTDGPDLADIASKLTEPVFAPYLGRKSCPIGLPLQAIEIDAATPIAALTLYDAQPRPELGYLNAPHKARQPLRHDLWLDEDDARTFELPVAERTVRRDRVRDRARWLFADRAEVRIAHEAKP
jgi:CRISPR system Cascade subunit CasD